MRKSILFLALMTATLFCAQQVQARTINLATEPGGSSDIWVYNGDVLTGTLATPRKIIISNGAKITLSDVIINGINDSQYRFAGIIIESGTSNQHSRVIIQLSGTNIIRGYHEYFPAIQVYTYSTLVIEAYSRGILNVSSNGKAPAIGASFTYDAGNIEIESGDIQATGGHMAAAIGGAQNRNCGTITISGGNITAQGGTYAPAIGGGAYAHCNGISICSTSEDVQIHATKGSYSNNSIGAAYHGTCGSVYICDEAYPDGISQSPYNISLEHVNPCLAPIGLRVVDEPGTNSITVEWTPVCDNSKWTIGIKKAEDDGPYVERIAYQSPHTLTNLTPNTKYKIAIKAQCPPNNWSAISEPIVVTTKAEEGSTNPEPCLTPTNVQVTNITTSSALLTFTPGSSDQTLWYVKCRPTGTVANIFARLVNKTSVTFTDLDPGTEYEVQIYADCDDRSSDPTEWFSFTTESDEGIESIPAPTDKPRKVMLEDQLYIATPDGKIYNATGAEVK